MDDCKGSAEPGYMWRTARMCEELIFDIEFIFCIQSNARQDDFIVMHTLNNFLTTATIRAFNLFVNSSDYASVYNENNTVAHDAMMRLPVSVRNDIKKQKSSIQRARNKLYGHTGNLDEIRNAIEKLFDIDWEPFNKAARSVFTEINEKYSVSPLTTKDIDRMIIEGISIADDSLVIRRTRWRS